MTVDERIEALTQSLELLAHIQQEHEKQTTRNFGTVLDPISRLEQIATRH